MYVNYVVYFPSCQCNTSYARLHSQLFSEFVVLRCRIRHRPAPVPIRINNFEIFIHHHLLSITYCKIHHTYWSWWHKLQSYLMNTVWFNLSCSYNSVKTVVEMLSLISWFFEKDYQIGNLFVGRDDIVSKVFIFKVASISYFLGEQESSFFLVVAF